MSVLDRAWDEAEAALPQGWVIGGLTAADEFVMGLWQAKAVKPRTAPRYPMGVYDDLVIGPDADSPAAALHALAAKLRERQP